MAFYAPLNLSTVNFPEFEWKWHAPHAFSHWTEDAWTNKIHIPKPIPRKQKATTPVFDVRETDEAFYFDGEFPGVSSKEDIKPRWINKRTLVIEATFTEVDLEKEWNILLSESELDDDKDATRDSVVEPDDGHDDLTLHRCLTNDSSSNHSGSADSDSLKKLQTKRTNSTSSQGSEKGRPSLEGLKKHLSWTAKSPKKAQRSPSPPTVRHLASERNTGNFTRTFTFPEDVLHASLDAKLKHGLLTMIIFKKEPMTPKPVAIEVGPDYFSDKRDLRGVPVSSPPCVGSPGQDRNRRIRFV